MQLDDLDKGDKHRFHLSLYTSELKVLDRLCAKYNCSRAAVVGAMIDRFSRADFSAEIPPGDRPGRGRYPHTRRSKP